MNVLRNVRDEMAESQDQQKQQADAKNMNVIGSEIKYYSMLKATNVVSAVFKKKLRPRFIGPFTAVAKKDLRIR